MWQRLTETLTFDIIETGPSDPFTEVDERPLRLAAREDVVVVCYSDDSIGSHGRCLSWRSLIGSLSSGWEINAHRISRWERPANLKHICIQAFS